MVQTPADAGIDVMIISRRRHAFHGPRFQPCGLDEFGNVSNFVETELILTGADTVFSSVQVRGGLPIFWDNHILSKKPESRKTDHLTQDIFDNHLKDLTDSYKRVVMLDLLKKKGSEAELVKQMEVLLEASSNKDVKHVVVGAFRALWESMEGISN